MTLSLISVWVGVPQPKDNIIEQNDKRKEDGKNIFESEMNLKLKQSENFTALG